MTTIAYCHKTRMIAVDGRVTLGGVIATDSFQKWVDKKDGKVWFLCGQEAGFDAFLGAFESMTKLEQDPCCSAIMVEDGRVYWCAIDEDDDMPKKALLTYASCMGSGEQFALSAIDMGKSAKDAVEYAKTRDCFSGGKVSVFDVAKMEFIE